MNPDKHSSCRRICRHILISYHKLILTNWQITERYTGSSRLKTIPLAIIHGIFKIMRNTEIVSREFYEIFEHQRTALNKQSATSQSATMNPEVRKMLGIDLD